MNPLLVLLLFLAGCATSLRIGFLMGQMKHARFMMEGWAVLALISHHRPVNIDDVANAFALERYNKTPSWPGPGT